MKLTGLDLLYLAASVEGFLFGVYSALFALYVLHRVGTDVKKQKIVFCTLCTLYVLSLAVFALDISTLVVPDDLVLYRIWIAQPSIFAICDFIAQAVLIHRCWIVWDLNMRVVIIPSILAFSYLVMWLTSLGGTFFIQGYDNQTTWSVALTLAGLVASLTVNALVTSLIVFRILKVFRVVKGVTTSAEKSLGITKGGKLRSVMFVIIESGMALFAIQLARLVISSVGLAMNVQSNVAYFIIPIHEMLNGITPTIILVRVSLGLSFHDEASLEEAVGSLQFAHDQNPNSETGSIGRDGSLYIGPDDLNPIVETTNVSQDRRDDNIGGSDQIQVVYR